MILYLVNVSYVYIHFGIHFGSLAVFRFLVLSCFSLSCAWVGRQVCCLVYVCSTFNRMYSNTFGIALPILLAVVSLPRCLYP